MKSTRIILISLFVLFSAGVNAQVFVGGNVGLNINGGTNDDDSKKPSSFSLNLSPKVGKFLSEKVAVGVAVNFSSSATNNHAAIEVVSKTSSLGISPFLRYYAIQIDKFSVFGQGSFGISFSSTKNEIDGTVNEGPKNNSISVNFVPGLAYDLNDRLSLETSINFLNVGFTQTSVSNGTNKSTDSAFGIGAGLNNMINTGSITIGAIYKF